MTYSADQFPPGSKERYDVANHSAGAGCNAKDVLEDWEEYDEDHTKDKQAKSWEFTDVDKEHPLSITDRKK